MDDTQPPAQPVKSAKNRITNLGAITVIRPIKDNANELREINAKDAEVLSEMKERNLYNLKYNNPPKKLNGSHKEHGNGLHPLADKIDKEKKEARKKQLALDTFTRVGIPSGYNSINIPSITPIPQLMPTDRPLTTQELREQRLKHFNNINQNNI